MSSDALKKRKSKVLRNEGGTPEMKRGRGEGEQQVTDTGSKVNRLMGPEGMCKEPGGFQQKNWDQSSENLPESFLPPI